MRRSTILLGAAAVYGVFIARTRFASGDVSGFTLFDDAMISMRFARNLAEGHGLRFNPGEAPVEGYSNPLWTLWMSVIHMGGVPDTLAPLAVAVTGALLLLATGWLASIVVARTWQLPRAANVAMLVVLLDYAFVYWTLRGMEVGLLGLLGLAAAWNAMRFEETRDTRRLIVLAIAVIAAILTRRDAALVVLVCAAWFAWVLTGRQRAVAIAAVTVAAAAALTAQTVFSYWYYGDPLPNTYYLKMTGRPALERVAHGASVGMLAMFRNIAPLLVPALVPLLRGPLRQRRAAALLLGMLGAQVAYSVYVGGDAWEYNGHANRFIATALPGLCVLAAVGVWQAVTAGFGAALLSGVLAAAGVRVLIEVASVTWNWAPTRGHTIYLAAPATVMVAALSIAAALFAVAWWLARGPHGPAEAGPYQREDYQRECTHAPAGAGFSRPRFASAATTLTIAWLAVNGHGFAAWAVANADHVRLDAAWAAHGVDLRRNASPETIVAVTAAGNLPYFSRLRTIDLHGKMDPVIARSRGIGEFRPGHDKWDLSHSLAGRPDLVVDFRPTPRESAYLAGLGYAPGPDQTFVLRASGLQVGGIE